MRITYREIKASLDEGEIVITGTDQDPTYVFSPIHVLVWLGERGGASVRVWRLSGARIWQTNELQHMPEALKDVVRTMVKSVGENWDALADEKEWADQDYGVVR